MVVGANRPSLSRLRVATTATSKLVRMDEQWGDVVLWQISVAEIHP